MTVHAGFRDYPAAFPAHSRPGAPRYRIRKDCFAALTEDAEFAAARIVFALPDEGWSVFAGAPPCGERAADLPLRPVYSLTPQELPAMPTGRIFVQAHAGEDLAAAIASLGYRIKSVPGYAPHAAWLVAENGSVAAALARFEKLCGLRALASAEAQMLRPSASR